MEFEELDIPGAFVFTPRQFGDDRGLFLEAFKANVFEEAVGHSLNLAQANTSVSAKGVVRGIHYAALPPSQAKYVMCTQGAIFDVVVDIRFGSPTFGQWRGVQLDSDNRKALYLSEGLGHAFVALGETNTVTYLCSEPYAPTREFAIHPLDPQIGIDWPDVGGLLLSEKDRVAPSFEVAQQSGTLPTFDDCLEFRDSLS
ncbi:MAG: dTDP-4-dehydrorhamnose 3,5-epimerase [Actinobacteria bacterium]|nr:dTDP-4-dehydrorhamnose 3,5-epimerase [Actinomycetota bacterium]